MGFDLHQLCFQVRIVRVSDPVLNLWVWTCISFNSISQMETGNSVTFLYFCSKIHLNHLKVLHSERIKELKWIKNASAFFWERKLARLELQPECAFRNMTGVQEPEKKFKEKKEERQTQKERDKGWQTKRTNPQEKKM